MGQNRKSHGAGVDASSTAPPSDVESPPDRADVSAGNSTRCIVFWQIVAVLATSGILGFAFNAASPVGVRFSADGNDSILASTVRTNLITPLAVLQSNPPATMPPVVIGSNLATQVRAARTNVVAVPVPPTPVPANLLPPGVATVSVASPPAEPNPAPIHWQQAKPLAAAGKALLVDVRAKGMFDAGHIPGAISLPESSSAEEIAAFLAQHPREVTLIFYCSSTSCSQSARVAARFVTQYGRPAVKYMTGGYQEYQQEELARRPATTAP